MPKPIFFLIAGGSATGKTVVSRGAAEQVQLEHLSVPLFVRDLILARGYASARGFIREKGVGVVKEFFPQIITEIKTKIAQSPRGIVLEGMYSPEFVRTVKDAFPDARYHLVKFSATRPARKYFLASRELLERRDVLRELRERDRLKNILGLTEVMKVPGFSFRNATQKEQAITAYFRDHLTR